MSIDAQASPFVAKAAVFASEGAVALALFG
jgi:hypothetical protein